MGMRFLVLALTCVALMACSTPGHRLPDVDWRQKTAPRPDYQLLPITTALVAELRARSAIVPARNEPLLRALASYDYRVGPMDVLSFTVWDHPELTIPAGEFRAAETQGHLVSPEGEIFFPYVGEVAVGGLTLTEIRTTITDRLARFIQNPQLDVRIAAFRSQKVNVAGQVNNPGFFPITDVPMTLVEAINLAGGPTDDAAMQAVKVLRSDLAQEYDMLALLESGDMSQNLLLADGDIIFVPHNAEYVVHVFGSVGEPGPIPLTDSKLNLAHALGLSGGLSPTESDPRRVLVFRNANEPKVYWLDFRSPGSMLLATQFQMKPQDVIFAASNDLANWNRIVSLVLPTIQSLWQTRALIDELTE